MGHADGGPLPRPEEEPDASGVHLSKEPTTEAGWRSVLSTDGGTLEPSLEALLNAYLRLQRRHAETVRWAEALAGALERVPLGLLVLLERRIRVANREAYRLIDGRGLRRTVDDELAASDPDVHESLLVALGRLERGEVARVALCVPRSGGALQLVLTSGGAAMSEAIIVALADPKTTPKTDPESYRSLYGLTPTESKVAAHLVLGRSSREIAKELGVGVETTRTHVKHILQKMGCHRQVDVVRRLVTGPTCLR